MKFDSSWQEGPPVSFGETVWLNRPAADFLSGFVQYFLEKMGVIFSHFKQLCQQPILSHLFQ